MPAAAPIKRKSTVRIYKQLFARWAQPPERPRQAHDVAVRVDFSQRPRHSTGMINGWRLLVGGLAIALGGVVCLRVLRMMSGRRRLSRGVVSESWLTQHATERSSDSSI